MFFRLSLLFLCIAACGPDEAPSSSVNDRKSYGFGRNGTPDDIWEARDSAPMNDSTLSVPETTSSIDTAVALDSGPRRISDSQGARSDATLADIEDTTTSTDLAPQSNDISTESQDGSSELQDTPPGPGDTGASSCGNGVIDPGEQCDFNLTGSCPDSCFDPPGCTATILEGSAAKCTARCTTIFVTELIDDDDCCPPSGTPETDSDCNLCGNGELDGDEVCDNSSNTSCPTESDCPTSSGCVQWQLIGSAETCDAQCVVDEVVLPLSGDECCPDGATELEDSDCVAVCGDQIVAANEGCEPGVPIDATCEEFGFSGGSLSCLNDCTISTLTCAGGHNLTYEFVSNIFLVGDIRNVVWHGSGAWALLVASDGALARYDAETGAIASLGPLGGTPYDAGASNDGQTIWVVGSKNSETSVWQVSEDENLAVQVAELELALDGDVATCVAADPTSSETAICTRMQGSGSYFNRVYRIDTDGAVISSITYVSSSGINDAMWTSSAYPGSNALITSEGYNGAGSESWVFASNLVVGNGWSPGFGNAGRAEWRPGGAYGIVVGTSTNSVYVYDGNWVMTKVPSANNGAIGNSIAWKSDGSRALVVSRPTGLPIQGSVFDHRPGGLAGYDATAWNNVSIPGFSEAPYNGSFNTHLLDVAWRPATECDEGLIVGADNGTNFNPTFGLVIRYYDPDDPDCL